MLFSHGIWALSLASLMGGVWAVGGDDSSPLTETPTPDLATPTPDAATPTPIEIPDDFPWCKDWYPDCDGDGFANPDEPLFACKNPNWSRNPPECTYYRVGLDCDDENPDISPDGVEGPDDPDSTIDGIDNDCDGVVDLDCDGLSNTAEPRLELRTPQRGSYAQGDRVSVTGVVYPSSLKSEISTVWVGDVEAELSVCGAEGGVYFEALAPVETGINTLEVWTQDASGQRDEAIVSTLYGQNFVDLDGGRIENALVSLLNQGTWDILGSYLETELSAEELEDELLANNPLIHDSGDDDCLEDWEIYGEATAYTHQDVNVSFVVHDGHITVAAELVGAEMWADGWASYDLEWYCGGWSDDTNLDAYARFDRVTATADGSLWLEGQEVRASFHNIQVNASGLHLDVNASNDLYDWLIDLFEDDLEDELEDFVEDELYDYVAEDLAPDLEDELNELDLNYAVDVSGVNYDIAFTYDNLDILAGGVDLGFAMSVDYDKDPRVVENPGYLSLSTAYTPDTDPTFGFRIGLDWFNGSLHGLWEGGSLHVADQVWDEPVIMGVAEPLLPPVLMPGTDPFLLRLNMGDLIAGLEIPAEDGTVYSLEAALSTQVATDIDVYVEGSSLLFEVNFGLVEVQYDLLGSDILPQEVIEASEAAMVELMHLVLAELETYLESLEISYLGVPMVVDSVEIQADPANGAMLAIDGEAHYTGP